MARSLVGEAGVIEGGGARALGGVDEDELGAGGGGDAIPEALVVEPVGADGGAEHQGCGVVGHELLGARVVGGGEGSGLGEERGAEGEGKGETHGKPEW